MPLPNYLLFFRDDLRLSTWILLGACLQSLLVLFLPRYLALFPAFTIVVSRVIISALRNEGFLSHPGFDKVRLGRTTAQIPNQDGSFSSTPADKDIVIFIIATRSSHPKGRFGPGLYETNNYFTTMWKDLAANREKWGFLGKTPTLAAIEDDCSNTLVWITYWKSLDHLHTWARGDSHRAGQNWLDLKKYPHIAIQHEMYFAPKGHWENIAYNFRPFGIGQTKHVVEGKDPSEIGTRLISPIQPAAGPVWKTMKTRMGKTENVS